MAAIKQRPRAEVLGRGAGSSNLRDAQECSMTVTEARPPSKDQQQVDGPFVKLNKNFGNYPLARDPRSGKEFKWYRGRTTGCWYGDITGYENQDQNQDQRKRIRIRYVLAPDTDRALRRCATAFDINVLLLILATAQHRTNARVVFDSRSEMLKLLGYGTDYASRQRLEQTLQYWSHVSLQFGCWHFAGSHLAGDPQVLRREPKPRDRIKRLSPPLLACSMLPQGRVTLELHADWFALHGYRFYEKLPLPLPRDAGGQNLVLTTMVSIRREGEYKTIAKPRRKRRFCRALGINHGRRNQVLAHALASAEAWYLQHNGKLIMVERDGQVNFVIERPRRKLPQPVAKAEPIVEAVVTPVRRRLAMQPPTEAARQRQEWEQERKRRADIRQRTALYAEYHRDPAVGRTAAWRVAAAKLGMPIPSTEEIDQRSGMMARLQDIFQRAIDAKHGGVTSRVSDDR
jgi:hypothetical protein